MSHRKEHHITITVSAPTDLTEDQVVILIQRLIDCGLSDATDTVNEGEGDLETAEAALNLNISAPEIDKTYPMEQAIKNIEAQCGREHPEWTRDEWQSDVAAGDTRLGYWEWVIHQLESAAGEE